MNLILGPITLTQKETLGKHFIATRSINPGELILQESTIFTFPRPLDKSIVVCFSCYKELNRNNYSRCDECKWPVCDASCAKAMEHADFECRYLSKDKIPFSVSNYPYMCIQTIRGLLLREKSPQNFGGILSLEPHVEMRNADLEKAKENKFVVDFIINKCMLCQFDEDLIQRVLGVTELNAFSSRVIDRHGWVMLVSSARFTSDCDPNTERLVSNVPLPEGSLVQYEFKFQATRKIEQGEIVTMAYYRDMSLGVIERRARLKRDFYFDCVCKRCQKELEEISN